MLRQFHLFTVPTAISIAFFDATFLLIAKSFGFSGGDILLGVSAGAAGGMSVLTALLRQSARKCTIQSAGDS